MYLTQHTNRLTHLELAVSTAASSSSIRFCIYLFSPCATANASRYLFASCLCCCTLKNLCCKTFCSLRWSLCIFASLIFCFFRSFFCFYCATDTLRYCLVPSTYYCYNQSHNLKPSRPPSLLCCGAVNHKIILLVWRIFFVHFYGLCDFSCLFLRVLLLVGWLIAHLLIV